MHTTRHAQGQRQKAKTQPLLLVLFLFSLFFSPAPAAAQPSPITLVVRAGYDGALRVGEWFPVDVQVANDGPDLRGVLAWSLPGQPGEGLFERAVELPRGARKRLTLYASARNFARNGLVQLRDGATVLAEQDVRLDADDSNRLLLGVVSSDPTLLNSLNSLQLPGTSSTSVRHIALETLPDQAGALRGLNMLFLHDTDTSMLSQGQRQALELWVQGGGQLVVSGGPDAARLTSGVAELLPVQIGGDLAQGDLAPLAQLTAGTAVTATTTAGPTPAPQPAPPAVTTSPGAAPLNAVAARGVADPLPSAATPLLYRRQLGNGTVVFTTFDLVRLRGWAGEVPLWQRLLEASSASTLNNGRGFHNDLLQETLRLPSLGLLSVRLLVALLLVYLLAVGPLNYFVLRRLGRLEWAWLSIPLTVLLFAATFYVVGLRLRGGTSQLHQAAYVQAVEGQPRGVATALVGLFSPQRTSYDLSFAPDALVGEARNASDGFNVSAVVRVTDADVQVSDLLVDVSAVRSLTVEAAVDAPVQVKSVFQLSGNSLSGEVRNTGIRILEDAMIVRGSQFQALGTLAPGAVQQFSLSGNGTNFPWGVNVAQVGFFNRQEMISNLFGSDNIRRLLDERGVYLLAWSKQPIIPVRLNGQDGGQDGITLYIVRLNGT